VQGIKSMVIIAYELLTKYNARFQRWGSLKAYAILNGIEPVFWFAVVVVSGSGASKGGSGAATAISVVTLLIALVLV